MFAAKCPGKTVCCDEVATNRGSRVEVHETKGHDDELASVVWGAAFYRHIVSAERGRLSEIDVLSWSMACANTVVPATLASLLG